MPMFLHPFELKIYAIPVKSFFSKTYPKQPVKNRQNKDLYEKW